MPLTAQILQVPVEQVPVEDLPMRLECRDAEYPLVVLVRNGFIVPRVIEVDAVFVDKDARIMDVSPSWPLEVEVAAGERALVGRCARLPDRKTREDVGAIRLRARATSQRVDLAPPILPFVTIQAPVVETWTEDGGYHLRARAAFLAENRRRDDIGLSGRVRFYNAQGYQVALCRFQGRVLAGIATRVGCTVFVLDLIPDTPQRARVEVLQILPLR
jgi:hypothetical protein